MASGKETPRQKMIGMMYLVLTALLALNVSKEIVNAFVKLNDKLEDSNKILQAKINGHYDELKNAVSLKHSAIVAKPWHEKALKAQALFNTEFNYVLSESNALIQETEGRTTAWLIKDAKTGTMKLRSLMEVESKDDYDAATRLFVGGDPVNPNQRGTQLKNRLHTMRDAVCALMGTYTQGKNNYTFNPRQIKHYDPKILTTHVELKKALRTVNPVDTAVIAQVYRTLSYPAQLTEYGEKVSWQGALFDHAPIVAAVAILTSLRSDIKTAESLVLEHFAGKIGKIDFPVNKIEAVAFASKGYLNIGDTMSLRVMMAAYDSNNVSQIKYSDQVDLSNGKEITGPINIKATSPGVKKVYGNIAVRQKGELMYKPWSFEYEVGVPTASIAQTDLNILYAGFDNNINATASGYAQTDLTLSGTGVSIVKNSSGGYIANVPLNMVGRKVTLYVFAKGKQVGNMEFRIKNLPKPMTFFGKFSSVASRISKTDLLTATNAGVFVGYDDSSPVPCVFRIKSCEIVISLPGGANTSPVKMNGGAIPNDLKQKINGLQKGASIVVRDVKAFGKPGTIPVAGVTLVVD